ncbi:MAG: putative protein YfgJ [Candidatus Erwinia impunctatus]|nr:putative protein YfgJ [Culicoides impunctatus]
MPENCPLCSAPLYQCEEAYQCNACQRQFTPQACCPDCGMPLEILKACGAVDYFCQHGHGMISRSRVVSVLREKKV